MRDYPNPSLFALFIGTIFAFLLSVSADSSHLIIFIVLETFTIILSTIGFLRRPQDFFNSIPVFIFIAISGISYLLEKFIPGFITQNGIGLTDFASILFNGLMISALLVLTSVIFDNFNQKHKFIELEFSTRYKYIKLFGLYSLIYGVFLIITLMIIGFSA